MSAKKLFTVVSPFYTEMIAALKQAQQTIHMAYLAFDDGRWARFIAHTLAQKAAAGVSVHLMVDELGQYLENLSNAYRNQRLLNRLATSGVQVDLFRPNGRRLSQFNRLHCKFCAIDDQIVFMGGSNIGDHYLRWRDSNIRIDGDLGNSFPQLYEGLRQFCGSENDYPPDLTALQIADMPLLLTVPGRRQDIRRHLLDLILSAKTAVSLRSWTFLPDKEIVNALLSQAENGVRVTILYSNRTRTPFIDIANRRLTHRLAKAGINIYRYVNGYMHAKEAWNDQGDILFGSANIDLWALRTNFECCLRIVDRALARELSLELNDDLIYCLPPKRGEEWQRLDKNSAISAMSALR